jgi:meiotic recombination protein SPO11
MLRLQFPVVLRECRKLRQLLRDKASVVDADQERKLPEGVPSDIVEVAELPAEQVLEGMEAIAMQIASQVLNKTGFSVEIPSRASTNQVYVKEWDRIVLGGKRSTRSFLNVKEARKSAITLRVLSLIHSVLMKRIHITKRDLFYTDVKLFVDQAESDGVLDDVATMIGCTRSK